MIPETATPQFEAYIKAIILPDDIRERNGLKKAGKTPRFDVVLMAGYYKPFEALKNHKGQIYLYLNDTAYTTSTANNPTRRHADKSLQAKDSLNVSSVYLIETPNPDGLIIGRGNPYGAATFGKKNLPNPFAGHEKDGFLFIFTPDYSQLEILVIAGGIDTIKANAFALFDGKYNEALKRMREAASTFFEY